jgi:hypothetical protein
MREIQASEAETHRARFLDAGQRGQAVAIDRPSRAGAHRRQRETGAAIETAAAMRRRAGKIDLDALLSAARDWRKP